MESKVRKTARIRNRYNQVPQLSKDAKWESNKITINITNKSQEVSPFPSDDHKTAMNRRESMANTRHKYHKPQTDLEISAMYHKIIGVYEKNVNLH